jgi:hypothetical protein
MKNQRAGESGIERASADVQVQLGLGHWVSMRKIIRLSREIEQKQFVFGNWATSQKRGCGYGEGGSDVRAGGGRSPRRFW